FALYHAQFGAAPSYDIATHVLKSLDRAGELHVISERFILVSNKPLIIASNLPACPRASPPAIQCHLIPLSNRYFLILGIIQPALNWIVCGLHRHSANINFAVRNVIADILDYPGKQLFIVFDTVTHHLKVKFCIPSHTTVLTYYISGFDRWAFFVA